MKNRLQFIHHEEVFPTREEAIRYVKNLQIDSRPSLFAEPMVLKYESGDETAGPNIILAIGSHGIGVYDDGEYKRTKNKTFFIDVKFQQEEIEDLYDKIEEAIGALTIIPLDSNTLDIYAESTEDGTYLSGDVKTAESKIISGIERSNTIEVIENEGLYHYVDLTYDSNGTLKFQVNDVVKDYSIPRVVSGEYVYEGEDTETIILTMSDDSVIKIPVSKLINEWTVIPEDANNTPIVLKRERVTSDNDGIESWQDILSADIRLHEGENNILIKKDADRTLFATVSLDYSELENKLVFKWSENGEIKTKDIFLNSVQVIEYIKYDPIKEEIVIGYKTSTAGEIIEIRIPVSDLVSEWTILNEGHNVVLNRIRSISGDDIVYADVRIADTSIAPNNIIETVGDNHGIYVRGTADNIKFGDTNVDVELNRLNSEDVRIEGKLDDEINRATEAEGILTNKIGSGFTDDPHANVTAKFNQIDETLNETIDDLANEAHTREEADNVLSGTIENEVQRAKTAESGLSSAISAEETRAIAAEGELRESIINEVNRAEGVEEIINKTIGDGLFSTDVHETITAYTNKIMSDTGTIETNLASEISRAKGVESGLTADLTAEVNRATAAESALTTNLANEVTRATAAESGLSSLISAEETRATAAESALTTNLANEVTRATAAESGLSSLISDEVTRAKGVESGLTTDLANEVTRATAAEGELSSAISAEETRAEGVEAKLANDIDTLDKKIGLGFSTDSHETVTYKFNELSGNVNTISGVVSGNIAEIETINGKLDGKVDSVTAKDSSIIVDNTDINNPKVGLNIRPDADNIIKLDSGIYVKVDLNYDSVTNTLTFTTSNGSKEINLLSSSIIYKISYDPTTEDIVILYYVNEELKELRVPVSGLIDEWEPDNHNHTITLTKVRDTSVDKDKLYGDVNISSDADNILEVVGDSTEYLKVSNAPIVAVDNRLTNEINRATNIENNLNASILTVSGKTITNEENIAALSGNVNTISGDVATLETNIININTDIDNIDGEISTISGDVNTLKSDVVDINSNIETINTKINSVSDDVITEKNRAETAETELGNRITNVFNRVLVTETSDNDTVIITKTVDGDNVKLTANVKIAEDIGDYKNLLKTTDKGALYVDAKLHSQNNALFVENNLIGLILSNSDTNNVKFNITQSGNIKIVNADVELYECGDY